MTLESLSKVQTYVWIRLKGEGDTSLFHYQSYFKVTVFKPENASLFLLNNICLANEEFKGFKKKNQTRQTQKANNQNQQKHKNEQNLTKNPKQ